jgi:hypothetical protein
MALVRAMLARDFWTAENVLAKWDPGAEHGVKSFASALAISAMELVVDACGGDRDRALAVADQLLDQTQAIYAARTGAA